MESHLHPCVSPMFLQPAFLHIPDHHKPKYYRTEFLISPGMDVLMESVIKKNMKVCNKQINKIYLPQLNSNIFQIGENIYIWIILEIWSFMTGQTEIVPDKIRQLKME